jgi:hypothetical protein
MIFRVMVKTAWWRCPPLWFPPQSRIASVLRLWVDHVSHGNLQTVLPLLSGR